jgi:NAD+-dependent protein deacetylase SIR2
MQLLLLSFNFGISGPEDCTVEEAMAYKRRLHEIGPEKFIFETVSSGKVTAKKLCSAFGIRAINVFEGQQDEAYYPLLGVAISRELSKRSRLPQYQTIDDAAKLLRNSKNIMVITGAGVSLAITLCYTVILDLICLNKTGIMTLNALHPFPQTNIDN